MRSHTPGAQRAGEGPAAGTARRAGAPARPSSSLWPWPPPPPSAAAPTSPPALAVSPPLSCVACAHTGLGASQDDLVSRCVTYLHLKGSFFQNDTFMGARHWGGYLFGDKHPSNYDAGCMFISQNTNCSLESLGCLPESHNDEDWVEVPATPGGLAPGSVVQSTTLRGDAQTQEPHRTLASSHQSWTAKRKRPTDTRTETAS